jgi:hypothetical protein
LFIHDEKDRREQKYKIKLCLSQAGITMKWDEEKAELGWNFSLRSTLVDACQA